MSPRHGREPSRKGPRRARTSTPTTVVSASGVDTASVLSPTPSSGQASPQVGSDHPAAAAATATRAPSPDSIMPGSAPVSRAERRARAKQQQQRRNLRVGAVVAAVVVLVGAVFVLLHRGGGADTPGNATGRTQTILAMTVSPMHSTALVSAMLATDPHDDSGAVVLMPSRLLLDAAGAGTVFFGDTPTLGKNAPAESLSNALGVTVDGSWSLTPSGLAALVDDVGGVDVTVDRDIVVRQPNGDRVVLLTAGPQHLKGSSAAVYATYLAPGEPEEARLARFNEVLQQVLGGLPTQAADVSPLVQHLGGDSQATVSDAALSAFLASLAKATQADGTLFQNLPVKSLETGGGPPAYSLDAVGAAALVDGALAASKPTDAAAQNVRVLVQNGVGTPGLGEQAYQKLHAAGFTFIPGGNANHFGSQKTVVLIPDGSSESIQTGQSVAKALGVPAGSVMIDDQGQTVADIVVILGQDFKP